MYHVFLLIFLFLGQKPVRNRNHIPKSDGCGSLGFEISSEYLPLEEMTKCCDAHDICYDTCNSGKEVCDLEFKRCLYNYCDTYKDINVAGNTITKGTFILNCEIISLTTLLEQFRLLSFKITLLIYIYSEYICVFNTDIVLNS